MLVDGVTQVATKNEYLYHEPMVHPALTAHESRAGLHHRRW